MAVANGRRDAIAQAVADAVDLGRHGERAVDEEDHVGAADTGLGLELHLHDAAIEGDLDAGHLGVHAHVHAHVHTRIRAEVGHREPRARAAARSHHAEGQHQQTVTQARSSHRRPC
jgi:hypothetical protein